MRTRTLIATALTTIAATGAATAAPSPWVHTVKGAGLSEHARLAESRGWPHQVTGRELDEAMARVWRHTGRWRHSIAGGCRTMGSGVAGQYRCSIRVEGRARRAAPRWVRQARVRVRVWEDGSYRIMYLGIPPRRTPRPAV